MIISTSPQDTRGDVCDNCPDVSNIHQIDTDEVRVFTKQFPFHKLLNMNLLFLTSDLHSSIFLVCLLPVNLDLKVQTVYIKRERFTKSTISNSTRAIRTALGINVTMTLTTTGWQTKRTTARTNPTRWA